MAAEYLERMGQRIRRRREFLRLSRGEVARAMPGKTNENAIYRWERGMHQPNPDALEALARVLEVDVAYFMADEPAPGTPDLMGALEEDRLSRIEASLVELHEKVDRLAEDVDDTAQAVTTAVAELAVRLGEVVRADSEAQSRKGRRKAT